MAGIPGKGGRAGRSGPKPLPEGQALSMTLTVRVTPEQHAKAARLGKSAIRALIDAA